MDPAGGESTDWRGYRINQPTIWNLDCKDQISSISGASSEGMFAARAAEPPPRLSHSSDYNDEQCIVDPYCNHRPVDDYDHNDRCVNDRDRNGNRFDTESDHNHRSVDDHDHNHLHTELDDHHDCDTEAGECECVA
ncbi:hypothetical protein GS425_02390 [Rhodococcus hoagii]|nr:hypothetical protein [Prescottella equi]